MLCAPWVATICPSGNFEFMPMSMPFPVDVQRVSSGVLALVMTELQLHVTLDPKVEPSSDVYVYENDIEQFYYDLISGRPYPLTLGVQTIKGPGTLLAITLFLHRDLAMRPNTSGLVANFALVAKQPVWGLSHMSSDMECFVGLLCAYATLNSEHVATAIGWLREFLLTGCFPQMPPAPSPPRVLDVGTNGFVVAKTGGNLVQGWVELYRQGHLRGLLIGAEDDTYRQVLIARKSFWVPLNLDTAADAFNAMENAMGEASNWVVDGDFLWGPSDGTGILAQHLMEVLLRI